MGHVLRGLNAEFAATHLDSSTLTRLALGQILDAGGAGDAGAQQGVDPGQLIHHYARGFAAAAPETALEYYMLAAKAQGDDRQTRARLLRELLVESGAFGFLLGSGGSRGGERRDH